MLELISHVVQISSRRDRTEINSAMVDALYQLFHPRRLSIFRCYTGTKKPMLYACASQGPEGKSLRNAYLPDKKYCMPLERDALLLRCRREKSTVFDFMADGSHRVVFPIMHLNEPIYLIDLALPDTFSGDQRMVLMGLVEYFGNHINLLDYGEADTLTGLASRKTFDKHLFECLGQAVADPQSNPEAESRRRGSSGNPHWLAVCDIDHFKQINDSLGHPVGDSVLKMVTARLESCVRLEDTVARLGGDEFVVLLSGLEGKRTEATREARSVADKLRTLLAEPMLIEGHRLQITPSIGIAMLPDHGDNPADLLKRADIALYRAKDSGRNTVQVFQKTMQTVASERLRLESDLRLALPRNEFLLHFQPQVDSQSQRMVGAEVLLRWQHPTLGQQSPALFIQILEESGLILEVGSWVLRQACQQTQQLLEQGLVQREDFSISVNISPRQFRQVDFVEQVMDCLENSRLPARMLKLEITEGIVIQNLDDTIAKMNRLKKLGVSFAMDDFGTGYSSLTYLKRLPVDVLKIDQSFVRDATSDPNDAEIIRAIVAMARSLNLEVIAEGVEQAEQLEFLLQQGCHHYQGYLFSKPVPLAEFHDLLQANRNR